MSERTLTFGGTVIPAHIASAPHIIRPTRKMSVVQIAGTNREIVDMQDAWECYNQPYSLYIGDGSEDSIQEALDEIASVLYKKGWQTLVDDYEPDVFRLAYYQGGFDADNRYTRLTKFDISFRCRPERFLPSGNTAVGITTGGTITNPTSYPAKPLIRITGSGSGTLTVAGTVMSFTGITDYLGKQPQYARSRFRYEALSHQTGRPQYAFDYKPFQRLDEQKDRQGGVSRTRRTLYVHLFLKTDYQRHGILLFRTRKRRRQPYGFGNHLQPQGIRHRTQNMARHRIRTFRSRPTFRIPRNPQPCRRLPCNVLILKGKDCPSQARMDWAQRQKDL